ncbi:50S ribosomal protein L15 [Gloeocapsa sp. PCC 73106]|uniref:50S ribosomal protein L15 n=1 Tax=Gloeocapsa sp. PCC 73106 TaxID=102232 RepID=UPI0002ABECEA|nr:50S ribosomal protein L15 [Gloeocapsa sp. PCC 73106]ELR98819.1 ribosomal protein L15, bacterial/organelle [Gloeocapsa sp. PCC 73106]
MRLNAIGPKKGSQKRPRRLGRGISAGQGASCGFGMRGQNSRAGTGTRAGFEGGQTPLYRRIPKLKHFPLVNPKCYTTLNVGRLASLSPNTLVNLEFLLEQRIVTGNNGPLKLLGDGELNVPLQVQAAAFTAKAKEKIEASGGSCQILERSQVRIEPESVEETTDGR